MNLDALINTGRLLAFAMADDLLIRQWSASDGNGPLAGLAIG